MRDEERKKRNEELQKELDGLSEEDKELTENLVKLSQVYSDTRKTFIPKAEDIQKRAKEKNITFNEARREIRKEIRPLQGNMAANALKLLKPKLSKSVRKKLGIKEAGRPEGSTNKNTKISKVTFYGQLKNLAKSNNRIDVETTEENAAKALGLGGARQLRRKLKDEHGDSRKWKDLIQDLLAE